MFNNLIHFLKSFLLGIFIYLFFYEIGINTFNCRLHMSYETQQTYTLL